ncbi:MAG: hypothetical protein ACK5LY_03690 [Lachnospirales bacterium]
MFFKKNRDNYINSSKCLTISTGMLKNNPFLNVNNYLCLDAYPQHDNRGFNIICRRYMRSIPVKSSYVIMVEADWNFKKNNKSGNFCSVADEIVDGIKNIQNIKYFLYKDDKYNKVFISVENNVQFVLDEIFEYTNCDEMKFSFYVYNKFTVDIESIQDILCFINDEKCDLSYYFEQSHDMFSIIYDADVFKESEVFDNFEKVCIDLKWSINCIKV